MESFVRQNEAGDVEHVAVVDGAHVVLSRVYAGNLPALIENAENRGDVAGSAKSSKGGVNSKTTVAELDAYAEEQGVADYPAEATKDEKLAAIRAHEEGGES